MGVSFEKRAWLLPIGVVTTIERAAFGEMGVRIYPE